MTAIVITNDYSLTGERGKQAAANGSAGVKRYALADSAVKLKGLLR